jgi:hypothetical protein
MSGRYFAMFVDISEMTSRFALSKVREIGITPDGERIMSELGSVVHDHIGSNTPIPDEVIGGCVFRIALHKGEWFVDAPMMVHWVGHREDIPDFVESEIHGDYEYFAAQPSGRGLRSTYYAYTHCEGVAGIQFPSLGKAVSELSQEELDGLFAEIDPESFVVIDENGDEMHWDSTFHCINCNEIIHEDDDANNCCGQCGCSEPGHPAPEGVNYYHLHEEWQ